MILQSRIWGWGLKCFGNVGLEERNDRFLEEALELGQSLGHSAERAHALVDYVYSRPVGEPFQEVGGTMVTLMLLAELASISAIGAAESELARISKPEVMEKIRAKQAAKPKGSALPGRAP